MKPDALGDHRFWLQGLRRRRFRRTVVFTILLGPACSGRSPQPQPTVGEAMRALELEREVARFAADSCYRIALASDRAADSALAVPIAVWRATREGDSLARAAERLGRIVVQLKVPVFKGLGHADPETLRQLYGPPSPLLDEARETLPRFTLGSARGECPRARVWTTLWPSDAYLSIVREAERRERALKQQDSLEAHPARTPPDSTVPPPNDAL